MFIYDHEKNLINVNHVIKIAKEKYPDGYFVTAILTYGTAILFKGSDTGANLYFKDVETKLRNRGNLL